MPVARRGAGVPYERMAARRSEQRDDEAYLAVSLHMIALIHMRGMPFTAAIMRGPANNSKCVSQYRRKRKEMHL